jgi:hypothetical protein
MRASAKACRLPFHTTDTRHNVTLDAADTDPGGTSARMRASNESRVARGSPLYIPSSS